MDHHLGILQERIESRAIGGERALHDRKRVSGKIQNQQEEDLDRSDDHGRVGKEPLIGLVTKAQDESVSRQ